jgi:ABC-type transport system substrate-binding protein
LIVSLTLVGINAVASPDEYFFSIHGWVGTEYTVDVSAMEIIKADLAEIGINLIIEPVEWATIQTASTSETRTFDEGGWDVAYGVIEMDGAPEHSSYFHSKNIPPPPGDNFHSWANGVSDELLDLAKVELDFDTRLDYYSDWQEVFFDEIPVLGIVQYDRTFLFSDKLNQEGIDFWLKYRSKSISDPTWSSQYFDIPDTDTIRIPENFPQYHLIPILGWSYNAGQFMPLFALNPDTLQPEPSFVAQSFEWSSDFMTLTVDLTPGLKWSDGEPFTSRDVKFTYEAIMNPDTGAPYHTRFTEAVESIETPDDLTVVIHLKVPDAFFLEKLSRYAGTEIVPAHQLELIPYAEWHGSEYNQQGGLASLGPWTFDTKVEGQFYRYRRNPSYYEVFGVPYEEFYLYEIIEDREIVLSNVEAGEFHVADTFYHWEDMWDEVKDLPGIIAASSDALDLDCLWINKNHPVLNNKYVRKALAYGINRNNILDTVYGGLGFLTDIPYPVGHYARAPALEPGYYPYDVDQAKSMMEMAGFDYDWLAPPAPPEVPYTAYGIGFGAGFIVAAVIVYAAVRVRRPTPT